MNIRPSYLSPSRRAWALAALACAGGAWAQPTDLSSVPANLDAHAPCVAAAARYHVVNPWILRAILSVESGFNPAAFNRNANGSIDVGMAQINSIHFGRLAAHNVTPADLMDGCKATYVAAWHLAQQLRAHGNTWYGIGTYHSASPCHNQRYAGLIWNRLVGWRVVPGPTLAVKSQAQCGYVAPRAAGRRSVAAGASTTSTSVAFDAPQ
ncbi:lytic transglycosylase domain-containing protein [Caenimonas sedimenti]|uniref:Lytic transglycosylase domain-containing protein n=1 Tax=Caenimonas sedimenti TaxID=2596921 RepID=A0A562ZS67_9BURK|nr:lytic transglycosylase domain-containing protein [Caenimonas sedimenti]TWO71440.1 lytic transglycosylase domain-containing protein [Caenimonas sedimenti]